MRYEAEQWPGVAVYISGEPEPEPCPECDGYGGGFTDEHDDEWRECKRCHGTGETADHLGWVYVTMVGDDARHLVERDTLSPLADDDYCSICGQVGCTADAR